MLKTSGESMAQGLYRVSHRERKQGKGQLLRTESWKNISRIWAIGWSLVVCYLALGYLKQRNIGMVSES